MLAVAPAAFAQLRRKSRHVANRKKGIRRLHLNRCSVGRDIGHDPHPSFRPIDFAAIIQRVEPQFLAALTIEPRDLFARHFHKAAFLRKELAGPESAQDIRRTRCIPGLRTEERTIHRPLRFGQRCRPQRLDQRERFLWLVLLVERQGLGRHKEGILRLRAEVFSRVFISLGQVRVQEHARVGEIVANHAIVRRELGEPRIDAIQVGGPPLMMLPRDKLAADGFIPRHQREQFPHQVILFALPTPAGDQSKEFRNFPRTVARLNRRQPPGVAGVGEPRRLPRRVGDECLAHEFTFRPRGRRHRLVQPRPLAPLQECSRDRLLHSGLLACFTRQRIEPLAALHGGTFPAKIVRERDRGSRIVFEFALERATILLRLRAVAMSQSGEHEHFLLSAQILALAKLLSVAQSALARSGVDRIPQQQRQGPHPEFGNTAQLFNPGAQLLIFSVAVFRQLQLGKIEPRRVVLRLKIDQRIKMHLRFYRAPHSQIGPRGEFVKLRTLRGRGFGVFNRIKRGAGYAVLQRNPNQFDAASERFVQTRYVLLVVNRFRGLLRLRCFGREPPVHQAALIVAKRLTRGEERIVVIALVHEFLRHPGELLAAPVLVSGPAMMPRDVVATGQDNECDHADDQPAA